MIISNNCAAGFFYKLNKIQYDNPFMWIRIKESELNTVISDYNNINWKNYKIIDSDRPNLKIVNVDNKINLLQAHYVKSDKDLEPRIVENNITGSINLYYNDIETYIRQKYESRISRMNNKIDGIILIHDFFPANSDTCSDEDVLKMVKLCEDKKIKLFIFSCKRKHLNIKNTKYIRWIDLEDLGILPNLIKFANSELKKHFGMK